MPIKDPPPFEVGQAITLLGENIRVARIRRRISQDALAKSCQIARRTLYGIESGAPGIAIGHIYTVLWTLGLLPTVAGIADPNTDEHGMILEAARRPQRARRALEKPDDNDF